MSFGGMRAASPEVELEDADDEDGGDSVQRIGLSEGAITLEQVRLYPSPDLLATNILPGTANHIAKRMAGDPRSAVTPFCLHH